MPLFEAKPGQGGLVKSITGNDKIRNFLFTLGCSEGEKITLISKLGSNFIIRVKDSRYAIDAGMARAIELV